MMVQKYHVVYILTMMVQKAHVVYILTMMVQKAHVVYILHRDDRTISRYCSIMFKEAGNKVRYGGKFVPSIFECNVLNQCLQDKLINFQDS